MDGANIVLPAARPPGGLARDDALFRIVYYGEALRAMTEHVSDTLISGSCGPMIDMLDEAFDRMTDSRPTFSPEEFTLFVMSRMLGLCEDAEEARQFRLGAARYILKAADALPQDYAPIVEDARRMLAGSDNAVAAVTASPGAAADTDAASAADLPAPQTEHAPGSPGPALTRPKRKTRSSIPGPLQKATVRKPPQARPEPAAAAKALAPAAATATAEATADTADSRFTRPVRIRSDAAQTAGRGFSLDKILILAALFVFFIAVVLVAAGVVDLPGHEILSRPILTGR